MARKFDGYMILPADPDVEIEWPECDVCGSECRENRIESTNQRGEVGKAWCSKACHGQRFGHMPYEGPLPWRSRFMGRG